MVNNARTPNQNKALQWFCKDRQLNPQLSAHPIYYFKNKDGEEVKFNMMTIMAEWEKMRKTEKERRGRVR